MSKEISLTKKINKYESKLGDLRDKIKGWISKGKQVPKEHKEKEAVYQGKLAYYRKLANMQGGVILDADQKLIDKAREKLDADAIGADEMKMKGINAQRDAIDAIVNENKVGNEERELLNNIIQGVEVTIEEPAGEIGESLFEGPPLLPPKPNSTTSQVFVSGTPSVKWSESEQQNFLNLLDKYGNELLKLVDSLQTLAPQQQQTIATIAAKLTGISDQLKYKDEVIKRYIQIFSKTQSGLSQFKATAEGIIDTSEVDSTLANITSDNNRDMLYYSLMTLIHSYLARLKTEPGMTLGDSEYNSVINGISTILLNGPEELKDALRNFASKEFNVNDSNNERIRQEIFNKINNS